MAETQEFGGGFHISEKDKVPAIPGVGMEGEMGFYFRCSIFLPEHIRDGDLTVVLPGFGHRASALGDSFRRSAKFIAEATSSPTIIPLEDWDPNHPDINRRYTYWMLGGLGRKIALAESMDMLDMDVTDERRQKLKQLMGIHGDIPKLNIQRIHFVGYSYHGPTALALAADYLPKTKSVVCVAPVDNRFEMAEVARESKLQLVSGEPDYALLFGRRGLPLIDPLAVPGKEEKEYEARRLREDAERLKSAGTPIKVLYGRGDPIMPMERSQNFARMTDAQMTIVNPVEATGSGIHDFDDQTMMKAITDALVE